ncbi:chemotaxis protein [Methylophilus aquaticus]|uniref:Chemotaxis protein n=1 Tax=Methylophilus aquaticus TaxID=1971610 RepID=A0ABT9JR73_9PROT|nr:chemotaxis protein [Methylophilus aquaticus]MDP8566984.1 chemotaxis protein [Methylophilus aquaticus]
MKTLPIDELRELLAAVSTHGDWHLLEIETDLQQTTFLLNEAIEKLSHSFMNVYAQLTEQQTALQLLADAGKLQPEEMQQLQIFQDNIGQEVNKVVTGMQFQDMTNQLIQRTINRVNGLKALLQELSSHQLPMTAEDEHDEIRNFIMQLNQNFGQGSQHLTGNLRKSVNQQDLASGDIDLF